MYCKCGSNSMVRWREKYQDWMCKECYFVVGQITEEWRDHATGETNKDLLTLQEWLDENTPDVP